MPELIIRSGKHQGKLLRLPDTEIVIGRDEQCQIRLASSDISRQHCKLTPTPEGLSVVDLGSRNGTFVNDVATQGATLLRPGDHLRVGPMEFQVPGTGAETTTPQAGEEALSDDDIASWLTEEALGEVGRARPGDTTIVSGQEAQEADEEPTPAPVREPPKPFKSIAEEAADIIRRHWKMVGGKPDESSSQTDR